MNTDSNCGESSITLNNSFKNTVIAMEQNCNNSITNCETCNDFPDIFLTPVLKVMKMTIVQMLISTKLRGWATKHNITGIAVNELLHILSLYHPNLPLNTPTKTTIKQLDNGGEYIYLGIENYLRYVMSVNLNHFDNISTIKMSIYIDGLPL